MMSKEENVIDDKRKEAVRKKIDNESVFWKLTPDKHEVIKSFPNKYSKIEYDIFVNYQHTLIHIIKFCEPNGSDWRFKELDGGITVEIGPTKIICISALLGETIATYEITNPVMLEVTIKERLPDNNVKIIFGNSIGMILDDDNATKLIEYCQNYNDYFKQIIIDKQNEVYKIANNIENIDKMSINCIDLIDKKYFINQRLMIKLQREFSYFPYFGYYNEMTYYNNIVAEINEKIEFMLEIIREKDTEYTDIDIKYACWYSIRKQAMKYYAKKWINEYDRFIQTKISESSNEILVKRYLSEIILSNEIENNEVTIGLLTYYFQYLGYIESEVLYTLAYDKIIDIWNCEVNKINENYHKKMLLKDIEEDKDMSETKYSINDIDLMTGKEFEEFICILFKKLGYYAYVTKQSGDQGIDVIAEKNDIKVGVQAKRYTGNVGNAAIQEAVAGKALYNCDKIIVVTNSNFTLAAETLAKANDVILWDRTILKEKIDEIN